MPPATLKRRRPKLLRSQSSILVGTSDTPFLPSNSRRVGLIISTPAGSPGAVSGTPASVAAQVTSAIGPQLTYTVPVGATAVCWGMVRSNVSATTKASYQPVITTGGQAVPYAAASSVSVITESFEVPLAAGDSASWVCTSAGAASVDQLQIFVTQYSGGGGGGNDVWLNFQGPAAVNTGIRLGQGTLPLVLWGDHIGLAFPEAIRAIASAAPTTLGIIEIAEEDCECLDVEGLVGWIVDPARKGGIGFVAPQP